MPIPRLTGSNLHAETHLLVVEVKKSTNKDFDGDIWKLQGLTEQAGAYAYAFGLHLVLDMKSGTAPRCDVYVDAQLNADLTDWMAHMLGGQA